MSNPFNDLWEQYEREQRQKVEPGSEAEVLLNHLLPSIKAVAVRFWNAAIETIEQIEAEPK